MKKLPILLILFLVGCQSGSPTAIQEPNYLTVFKEFQKSPLYEKCEQFEEDIRRNVHESHGIMPSSVTSDMEIDNGTVSNGVYKADISCEVRAIYSFSATTHVTEEEVISLGELRFDY